MSDFDEYIKGGNPSQKEKSYAWQTAIGLQDVDGLKPSDYLVQTAKQNIDGDISINEVKQLLEVTKASLYNAIDVACAGNHLGDIGHAVQTLCESQGYGVVRVLTGHGIGREMHEEPQVPNYGSQGEGIMLKSGMCLAIEPMVTMGTRKVMLMSDGWTIKTLDGKPAAHFEHTIAVRHGKADILSSFSEIES